MSEFSESFIEAEPAIPDERVTTSFTPPLNLLRQDTVPMTVFAQDPSVVADDPRGKRPVLARVPVPADRMQRGPRNHRFHVVDIAVGANRAGDPVVIHDESPWRFKDRWGEDDESPAVADLPSDREFRAQNVFAVAAHTLALFERHLGRTVPWYSGWPHLYLIPDAKVEKNASYSRKHAAVLFGWLPALEDRAEIHTSLSYDVIAHEVTHAILDGLRPRYTEPGLPDQLAFHEALADLVALFSVFDLPGVALHLLDPDGNGTVVFGSNTRDGRAEELKNSPLTGLAEQLGRPGGTRPGEGLYPALRRSVKLTPGTQWLHDPRYVEPHRRAEILVAAFMQAFVDMWAGRLEPLRDVGGMDAPRVAEEGVKAARHLLAMLLRALDYLPPVELEFADVIDAVITADTRLAPNDEHGYRDALTAAFAAFGITAPPHQILDEDQIVGPASSEVNGADAAAAAPTAGYPPDPDSQTQHLGLRYEHLNVVALRSSPEAVYQFIWNNAALLGIDVRLSTRVDRVLASTRVGPDGLVVSEVVADYSQLMRTTAARLPYGTVAPAGMDPDAVVELWGSGVLVFDQFGRFRLHQRKPILDGDRQSRRLAHLFAAGLRDRRGGFGTTDGVRESERFAMLHRDSEAGW